MTARERIDRLKNATYNFEVRDERDVVLAELIAILDILVREADPEITRGALGMEHSKNEAR